MKKEIPKPLKFKKLTQITDKKPEELNKSYVKFLTLLN